MNFYDLAYAIGVGVSAPVWLVRPGARRKVLAALGNRMGKVSARVGGGKAVMIHAVSLGEINSTRELIRQLRAAGGGGGEGFHFIVSTTTDTGFARAGELYGKEGDITLVRFPVDFSWAVARMLDRLRPSVAVLMELEVWPNFVGACERRGIPVMVINGRLTGASFGRYRMIRPLVAGMFGKIARVCAQDQTYADRFAELGVAPKRISVTGTMKFDTAEVSDCVAGAAEMGAAVGLKAGELVWVCGSTGPGEEAIVLECYRRLVARFGNLRLVIVPRHPQRFDEVAGLIGAGGFGCVRRSARGGGVGGEISDVPFVVLGDTMGELRGWYSLADVVLVGRSLVDLGARQHGSDMIEPAALGRAVVVGEFTGNFAEPMEKFVAGGGMRVVRGGGELERVVGELLGDSGLRGELGRRAREVVVKEQGATGRHVGAILGEMNAV